MFRALLAHPQEVLYKQHLECVLCQLAAPGLQFHSNPGTANWHYTHAIYQVVFVQRLLEMRNMWSPLILNKPNKKYITLIHYTKV
jgi:hypothetical protein